MENVDVVIVLCGEHTHTATGVNTAASARQSTAEARPRPSSAARRWGVVDWGAVARRRKAKRNGVGGGAVYRPVTAARFGDAVIDAGSINRLPLRGLRRLQFSDPAWCRRRGARGVKRKNVRRNA